MTNKSNFQKIEFYSVEVIKRYENSDMKWSDVCDEKSV